MLADDGQGGIARVIIAAMKGEKAANWNSIGGCSLANPIENCKRLWRIHPQRESYSMPILQISDSTAVSQAECPTELSGRRH